MNVQSAASRQARQAPAANFTGAVFQDPLARADGPSKTNATTVTFVPGARTVWHKHDMRQILVVTAGVGILQIRGNRPKHAPWRRGDRATRRRTLARCFRQLAVCPYLHSGKQAGGHRLGRPGLRGRLSHRQRPNCRIILVSARGVVDRSTRGLDPTDR